jgi:hypothetical protein
MVASLRWGDRLLPAELPVERVEVPLRLLLLFVLFRLAIACSLLCDGDNVTASTNEADTGKIAETREFLKRPLRLLHVQ